MPANYLNHVCIAAPRNATNSHTVDPNGGTVVTGTNFLPTAGRFLLLVCAGPVTFTTPSGWTLPTNGSADNFGSCTVFYRASAAGSDTVTTTHNGTNYPASYDFYEYPAGTTFAGAAQAINVSKAGGAGPTLSGLTGTNDGFGTVDSDVTSGASGSSTWSVGTEVVDSFVAASGTDGYVYGATYIQDSTASSLSSAATVTASGGGATERLMFAVTLPAAAAAGAEVIVVPRIAVHRAASW